MKNSIITINNHCSFFVKLLTFLGVVFLFPNSGIANANSNHADEHSASSASSASFCNLRVWFKNRGCKSMEIFRVENGRERNRRRVNPNGTAEFDGKKGDRFIIRVAGRKIKDWKVPNCKDQTQMIDTKGCDENCRVRIGFKNTGCNRLNIFSLKNGKERRVGHINPNETTRVDATKNQQFRFRTVEGGKKVKDWRVSKCENSTQKVNSGKCIKQPDCNDVRVTSTRGRITVKGLGDAPISEIQIIRTSDRKQVAGCRRCTGRSTRNFNVRGGSYWVKVWFFDRSMRRICDIQRDINVRDLTKEQTTSAGNRIGSSTSSSTVSKPLSTKQSVSTNTINTNTKIELKSGKGLSLDDVKIYPNPASTTLFVEVNVVVDQYLQASLLNAQGEVVQTTTVGPAAQTIRFDLSSQPMGIYLVRLQSDSGQALTQKLFIR